MNTLKNAKKRRLPDERFEVSSGGKAGNLPNLSAFLRTSVLSFPASVSPGVFPASLLV